MSLFRLLSILILLNISFERGFGQIPKINETINDVTIKLKSQDYAGSVGILEELRKDYLSDKSNIGFLVWVDANLSRCYYGLKKYDRAETLLSDFQNYEPYLLQSFPEEYLLFIQSVCFSLLSNNRFDEAENELIKLKGIIESFNFSNSIEKASCYYYLGSIYNAQGDLIRASTFYNKALELAIKSPKSDWSLSVIKSIYESLIPLDISNNHFNKAEKSINDYKEFLTSSADSTSVSFLFDIEANFYLRVGNYDKAIRVMNEGLDLIAKLNIRKQELIPHLMVLAGVQNEAGYFTAMKVTFEKAINIANEIINYPKIDLLGIYSFFAINLQDYDLDMAEQINLNAVNLIEKNNLDKTAEAASIYNNLAILYSFGAKQNLNKSLIFASKSLEIYKSLGQKSLKYVNGLSLLGSIYYNMGNYDSSLLLSKLALKLTKDNFGERNPVYKGELLKITGILEAKKEYDTSIKYLKEWNDRFKDFISENYLQLVNNGLENNIDLRTHFETLDHKLNSYQYYKDKSEINGISYDNKLFIKNLILRNWISINKNIQIDSNARNIYSQLTKVKSALLKFYSFPSHDINEINKLETKKDSLETNLIKISPFYKNIKSQLNISWQNIEKILKTNEAAIEFGSFNYFLKDSTPSDLYFALVLRNGYSNPEYVPLFFKNSLDKIMSLKASMSDSLFLNNLYSYNTGIFYQLIWKPLDSLLQGVKTIYAAPSGILNKINLAAIPINADSTFSTKYNLHILGTTADIINYSPLQINKNTIDNAYLFGGIDYDKANSSVTISNNSEDDNYAGFSQVATSAERGYVHSWSYLPGTLKEGSGIQSLCNKAGIKTTLLTGRNASENNFKSLSGSSKPFILHLATHGYFFPDIKKEKPKEVSLMVEDRGSIYKSSEDPLLRSGLILAGANKAWGNNNYKSDSTEDGILTAYEVSNTDLSKAQLVVMSACETGLGDINGGEGVFGLQRGFKLAGAKDIIMSLWKVPDAQTSELLTLFYTNCLNGKSVPDALQSAQLQMQKKYPPYYWAAFKLLE